MFVRTYPRKALCGLCSFQFSLQMLPAGLGAYQYLFIGQTDYMLDVTIIDGLFQPTCRLLISILVSILKIEIDMVGVIHFPAGYLKKSFINLLFVVSHLKFTSPRIRTSSCRASHTFACWVPHRANIHRQYLGLLHETKCINLHPLHYKRVFHCEISIVSVFVVNGKLCSLHGDRGIDILDFYFIAFRCQFQHIRHFILAGIYLNKGRSVPEDLASGLDTVIAFSVEYSYHIRVDGFAFAILR